MLVTLAWSCAGEHNISDRSNSSNHSSSELSPASGEAAGQSDALSLETACIARQVPQAQRETHHYTYDATRTTEKCYLTAIPELPLAPSTHTSGDEPQEDQDQVEKTSPPPPLPYAASYNASSGVLSISAPEIHDKLKLTDTHGVTYPTRYSLTGRKSGRNHQEYSKGFKSYISTSKNHIYLHGLKTLETHLQKIKILKRHSDYAEAHDSITTASDNFSLKLTVYIKRTPDTREQPITRISFKGRNISSTGTTVLRDLFIILGRYPIPTLSPPPPSTNPPSPSEAFAKMFAKQFRPLLLNAPSETAPSEP